MPCTFKKINNQGFSFVPILILVIAVGIVGIFSITFFKNSDVLVVTTSGNKVSLDLAFFENPRFKNYDVNLNIKSSSKENLAKIREKIRTKGMLVEYYCDRGSCSSNSQIIYPSKLNDYSGGFSFDIKGVKNQIKSISISDKSVSRDGLETINITTSDSRDKWRVNNNLGVDFISNNIVIESFEPNPSNNPSIIKYRISGVGEIFYGLVRNLNSRGVTINECNTSGANCINSDRKVQGLRLLPSSSISDTYEFTINVSQNTNTISLLTGKTNSSNIRWSIREKNGWRVLPDQLTVENTNSKSRVVPSLSITSFRSEITTRFVFNVSGAGTNLTSLMNSLRGGVFYKTSKSKDVLTASPVVCTQTRCEFVLPSTVNSIYFRSPQIVSFTLVPSGWNINSSGSGIDVK